ncbi:MAG: fasciclin domain-containing protein [Rhodothermales bacterium]
MCNPSFIASLYLAGAIVLAGCQPAAPEASFNDDFRDQGQANVVDNVSEMNILKIARSSPDHTTLAAAIDAAGLQHVLVNPGPLTVFAPTNAAFDALPAGTVEELLKPENKSKLAKIVTSHASPGTYKDSNLNPNMKIYLATGQYVSVEKRGDDTYVNGARILATIDASNGVVHVVDKVFLFPEM